MPSRPKKKQMHRAEVAQEKENVLQSLQPEEAEMILEELTDETRTAVLRKVSVEQMSYSGPIPPPSEMAKYNDVIPNGADRIMTMAENQSNHRQSLESSVVKAKNIDSRLGVMFAGSIGLVSLVLAYLLIKEGKTVAGFVFGGTPLGTLVGVYLRGTHLDKQDLEEKRKND